MSKEYRHLSQEEREWIAVMRAEGASQREMAERLGRDKSTISRELSRNAPDINKGYYLGHKAHERALQRWQSRHVKLRLKYSRLRQEVNKQLSEGLSPELIAGRLNLVHGKRTISHEAIYQYIYEERPDLIKYLLRSHKRRKRRGYSRKHSRSHIPNRVSIEDRPAIVNRRKRPGDWETDTVISRKSPVALSVLGDRASRLVKIRKINRTTGQEVRQAIQKVLGEYPQPLRKTLTYDNGHENVEHEQTNGILGTASYFCHPYHSWEKGTVENLIGLIRRYLPKGTDFSKITASQIQAIEDRLNTRPKKCLAFRTPLEVFDQLAAVALAG